MNKKNIFRILAILIAVFVLLYIFLYGFNPKYDLTDDQLNKFDNLTAEETIKLFTYYENKGDLEKIKILLSQNVIDEFSSSDNKNSIFLSKYENVESKTDYLYNKRGLNYGNVYQYKSYTVYWSSNPMVKFGYKSDDNSNSSEVELVQETQHSNWIITYIGNP